MKITKKVTVSTNITPEDLGLTFANANAPDQTDFLVTVATEFDKFDLEGGSRNLQLEYVASEIAYEKPDYAQNIVKWLKDLAEKTEEAIKRREEYGDDDDESIMES